MRGRFCFTIEGRKFYAGMQDTPLAEQIAAMCPFERTYTRNMGNEYYTKLPVQARQDGSELISKANKNQICFFEAWNAMNIIFKDCDIAPYKIAYMGEFEEDVSQLLLNEKDTLLIQCEDVTE